MIEISRFFFCMCANVKNILITGAVIFEAEGAPIKKAGNNMFKIEWDKETGGVILSSRVTKDTLGISPRPVWSEELDLLGLDQLGWKYPHCCYLRRFRGPSHRWGRWW